MARRLIVLPDDSGEPIRSAIEPPNSDIPCWLSVRMPSTSPTTQSAIPRPFAM